MRIEDGTERGPRAEIEVNGHSVQAYEGETIATALVACGVAGFRLDTRGRPRGLFCNMGTCCECLVSVEQPGGARKRVRACLTLVRPGQIIEIEEAQGG